MQSGHLNSDVVVAPAGILVLFSVVSVVVVWAGVIDLISFFIYALDFSSENYSIIDSMNSVQCQWIMGHSGNGPGYLVSR